MGYISPSGHTPESYSAMAVKLSYTTVITRSLQGDVRCVVNDGYIFSLDVLSWDTDLCLQL